MADASAFAGSAAEENRGQLIEATTTYAARPRKTHRPTSSATTRISHKSRMVKQRRMTIQLMNEQVIDRHHRHPNAGGNQRDGPHHSLDRGTGSFAHCTRCGPRLAQAAAKAVAQSPQLSRSETARFPRTWSALGFRPFACGGSLFSR